MDLKTLPSLLPSLLIIRTKTLVPTVLIKTHSSTHSPLRSSLLPRRRMIRPSLLLLVPPIGLGYRSHTMRLLICMRTSRPLLTLPHILLAKSMIYYPSLLVPITLLVDLELLWRLVDPPLWMWRGAEKTPTPTLIMMDSLILSRLFSMMWLVVALMILCWCRNQRWVLTAVFFYTTFHIVLQCWTDYSLFLDAFLHHLK